MTQICPKMQICINISLYVDEKAQIRLNLLIGLKGIKYKNRISCTENLKMVNMVDILLRLY